MSFSITTRLFVNVSRNLASIEVAIHIFSLLPMVAIDEYTNRCGRISSIVHSFRYKLRLSSGDENNTPFRLSFGLPLLCSLFLKLNTNLLFISNSDLENL